MIPPPEYFLIKQKVVEISEILVIEIVPWENVTKIFHIAIMCEMIQVIDKRDVVD